MTNVISKYIYTLLLLFQFNEITIITREILLIRAIHLRFYITLFHHLINAFASIIIFLLPPLVSHTSLRMYAPPEARSANDLRRWGDVSNWIVEEVANEDEEKGGEDTGRLLAVLLSPP